MSACFAKLIGAEYYVPTEKEQRQIAALLAEGYPVVVIQAALQRVVTRESQRGRAVRSMAYGLPAVRDA